MMLASPFKYIVGIVVRVGHTAANLSKKNICMCIYIYIWSLTGNVVEVIQILHFCRLVNISLIFSHLRVYDIHKVC